jgi:hypothetical protein
MASPWIGGNIWNDATGATLCVVTKKGENHGVFRNPVNSVGLETRPIRLRECDYSQFPASPFLLKKQFCTPNSDYNRRDNSPSSLGEINSGGPVGARGKISCMDEELKVPGLKLPVH